MPRTGRGMTAAERRPPLHEMTSVLHPIALAPGAFGEHRHLSPHHSRPKAGATMTGEEADEQEELEAQLGTAMEGLQRAVVRCCKTARSTPSSWFSPWRGSRARSGPARRWRASRTP